MKSEYYGLSWHKHRQAWRAGFRWNGKDVYLGCFRDEELGAWAVDFARYLLLGMNPSKWHFNAGKPNGPPRNREDYPRVLLITRLARVIDAQKLSERLKTFDSVVR